jgi:predicted HTH transcriptional regulator
LLLPDRLQDWTIRHVEQLVQRGVHENDQFDLKEMLPHPADNAGKMRLKKTCAAFANSAGGYLIFGVADASQKL